MVQYFINNKATVITRIAVSVTFVLSIAFAFAFDDVTPASMLMM